MKIIHTADLHIGSKFIKIKDDNKRKELIHTLSNSFIDIIEYAKSNNINYVLLSGDVFDSDTVIKKDKDFFYSIIKSNPNINFYYIKGNHDFKSKYEDEIENLHLFTNGITKYYIKDQNVLIAGYELSENNKELYKMTPLTKDYYNILMLHGDISKKEGKDSIDIEKLKDKNINYLALGHIHKRMSSKFSLNGTYVYPGCLMPRGFDEEGEKGFEVLDTSNNSVNFIKTNKYEFKKMEINLKKFNNLYDLISYLNTIPTNKNLLIQFIFTGVYNFDLNIEKILSSITDKFYYVDIKVLAKENALETEIIDERSLKGMFIKLLKEDSSIDATVKEDILKYGLSCIEKKEA